jgi:hypothetical protein
LPELAVDGVQRFRSIQGDSDDLIIFVIENRCCHIVPRIQAMNAWYVGVEDMFDITPKLLLPTATAIV